MKRLTLRPEQILVSGEWNLENESILKIYFRAFDRGHGKDFPPVIVTSPKHFDYLKEVEARAEVDVKFFREEWPKINNRVTEDDVENSIRRVQKQVQN